MHAMPRDQPRQSNRVSKPSGTVIAPESHDSGLVTSVPTAVSYAETVFSDRGTRWPSSAVRTASRT